MRSRALFAVAGTAISVALVATAATAFGIGRSDPPSEPRSFGVTALSNAFTFQGALDDGGSPANGAYDFRFILYDDAVGGGQVGPIVSVNDLNVSGGIFTATLDFGAVFQGNARWVEVQVRPGASSGRVLPGRRSRLYCVIAFWTVWVLSVLSSMVATGIPLAVSTTSRVSLVLVSNRTCRRMRSLTASDASTTSVS